MKITAQDKAAAIKREIGMRRAVYPKRVANGKMNQADADRQIAIMEAIYNDYQQQTKRQSPSLFD